LSNPESSVSSTSPSNTRKKGKKFEELEEKRGQRSLPSERDDFAKQQVNCPERGRRANLAF